MKPLSDKFVFQFLRAEMGRDYQLAKKLCQMSKYKTLTFPGIPLFLETDPTIQRWPDYPSLENSLPTSQGSLRINEFGYLWTHWDF